MRTSICKSPENNPDVFPYGRFPFSYCLSKETNGKNVILFPCVMKRDIANLVCIRLDTVHDASEAKLNRKNVAANNVFYYNEMRYDNSEVYEAADISISRLLDNRPSPRIDPMEVIFDPFFYDIVCVEQIPLPNGSKVPHICSLTEITTKKENTAVINTVFSTKNRTGNLEGEEACNGSTDIDNPAIPRTAINSDDNTDNTPDTNTETTSGSKIEIDPGKITDNTTFTDKTNIPGNSRIITTGSSIATNSGRNTTGIGSTDSENDNTDNSGNSTDEANNSKDDTATTDTGNTADSTAASGSGNNTRTDENSSSSNAGDNTSSNTPGNNRASGSNDPAGRTTGNKSGTGTSNTTGPSTVNTSCKGTRDMAAITTSGNSTSDSKSTTTAIASGNITGNSESTASTSSASTANTSGISTDSTSGTIRADTPEHGTDNAAGVRIDKTSSSMASSSASTIGSSTINSSGSNCSKRTSTSRANIAHTSAVDTTDNTSDRNTANMTAPSTCYERTTRSSGDKEETSGTSPRKKKLKLCPRHRYTFSDHALESVPVNIANTVTVDSASTSTASTEDINNSKMISNTSNSERCNKKRSRSIEADPRKKMRSGTTDAVDSSVLSIGLVGELTTLDREAFYREEEIPRRALMERSIERMASIYEEVFSDEEEKFNVQNEDETLSVSQTTHQNPTSDFEEDASATGQKKIILEAGNGSVLVGADISVTSDHDSPLLDQEKDPHLPRLDCSSSSEELLSTSIGPGTIDIDIPCRVDGLEDNLTLITDNFDFTGSDELATSSPVSEESLTPSNLEVQPLSNIPTSSPFSSDPTSVEKSASNASPDAESSSSISPDPDGPRSNATASYSSGEDSHSEDFSILNPLGTKSGIKYLGVVVDPDEQESSDVSSESLSDEQEGSDISGESSPEEQRQRFRGEVGPGGSTKNPYEVGSDRSRESSPEEQRQRFRGKVGPGGSTRNPSEEDGESSPEEQRQRFRGKVGPGGSTKNPSEIGSDDSGESSPEEQRQRFRGKVGPGGSTKNPSEVGSDDSGESSPEEQRHRFRGKVGPGGSTKPI